MNNMDKTYMQNINELNKNINKLIYLINQENNICINKMGLFLNKDLNIIFKNSFNDNIDILKLLKNNCINHVNKINKLFDYYINNIQIIRTISDNKYINNINIDSFNCNINNNINNNNNNNNNINNNNNSGNNNNNNRSEIYYNVTKNVRCKFNIVNNINQIMPCISWFEGNKFIKKGLYMCICKNLYIKLRLSSFSKKINPIKVNLCKIKDKKKCKKIKEKCYDIHYGDKINKLEYDNNICNVNMFGNPYSLNKDLKNINIDSVKMLTSYLASDILSLYCWYYFNCNNKNMTIIEKPFIFSKKYK